MVRSICWLTMLLTSYISYVRYVKWMLWIYFRIFGIRLRWSKVFFIRIFLLEKKSHVCTRTLGGGSHWLQIWRSPNCANQATTCSKDKRIIYTWHANDDICKVILRRCDLQRKRGAKHSFGHDLRQECPFQLIQLAISSWEFTLQDNV